MQEQWLETLSTKWTIPESTSCHLQSQSAYLSLAPDSNLKVQEFEV